MSRWNALRVNIARLRPTGRRDRVEGTATGTTRIEVHEQVTARDMSITTARILDGTPVVVSGVVVPTTSGVEFVGDLHSTWVGECRRCVDAVSGPIDAHVRATFLDAVDGEDDADAYPIDGDWIDIGELVFEELMLSLPLSPLCSEECAGADPERFPAITGQPSPDTVPDRDPRWAALSEIHFDED